jgi:hypothetical protein
MIWTLVLLCVALIFAYYTFALLYHWIRFGFLYPMAFLALPIWAIGSGILLMLTLAAYAAL